MTDVMITVSDDLEEALMAYQRGREGDRGLPAAIEAVLRDYLIATGYLLDQRPFRPLRITPAPDGSGLHDVSINHDKYLAEDIAKK